MSDNPLKQYFRRPGVYLKLPSLGKGYPEGSLEMPVTGELPIYPMTAIDEITSRTPDALYNGISVTQIIQSCVPNIKDPWEISALDLDSIFLAIRAASGSGEIDIDTTCPNCKNVATYSLEIPRLLSSLKAADYDVELQINDLSIKFKPIKFKEINEASLAQFEVSRLYQNITVAQTDQEKLEISQNALKSITELTMNIIAKGIEYIKTPSAIVTEKEHILDYLMNCDKNSYTRIRDYSTELKSQSELRPVHITCDSCTHEYDQSIQLNPSDFFG